QEPRLDLARGREDAEGHRQVEGGAFLAQVGGREVDGDAPAGRLVTRVLEGREHAFARLLDGRVGKPHQTEARQSEGDVDLDGDGHRLDALEGAAVKYRKHAGGSATPCRRAASGRDVPRGMPARTPEASVAGVAPGADVRP